MFLSFGINNCWPKTVQRRRLMKKSRKLACHGGQCKHRHWYVLCRHQKNSRSYRVIWKDLWRRADFYHHLKYARMYNTVFLILCMMWKVCRSPTLCRFSARTAERETYRINTTLTPPLLSLVNTLKCSVPTAYSCVRSSICTVAC